MLFVKNTASAVGILEIIAEAVLGAILERIYTATFLLMCGRILAALFGLIEEYKVMRFLIFAFCPALMRWILDSIFFNSFSSNFICFSRVLISSFLAFTPEAKTLTGNMDNVIRIIKEGKIFIIITKFITLFSRFQGLPLIVTI